METIEKTRISNENGIIQEFAVTSTSEAFIVIIQHRWDGMTTLKFVREELDIMPSLAAGQNNPKQ